MPFVIKLSGGRVKHHISLTPRQKEAKPHQSDSLTNEYSTFDKGRSGCSPETGLPADDTATLQVWKLKKISAAWDIYGKKAGVNNKA